MDRYFKGYRSDCDGKHHLRACFCELEMAIEDVLGEGNYFSIIACTLEKGAYERYASTEEMEKDGWHIDREIGKDEYELYRTIGHLLDEIYLNQYIGGFPSTDRTLLCSKTLSKKVTMAVNEMAARND